MSHIRTAGALLLPLLMAGCTVTVDSHSRMSRQEKRFAVSGDPIVRVSTFDGAIEIQSWDRPEVLVEIEKRGATQEALEGIEVAASQDGRTIDITVRRPDGQPFSGIGFQSSSSARLIVSVPRRSDVRARSGDGALRVERVQGKIDLQTGDGSIRAEDVSGEISLTTGDGSIAVDGAQGRLVLDTGDGSVDVTGRLGSVRLHTGDGSIVYRSEPGSAMEGDWDISTGDGAVSLYLPPDFAAELDAHTGGGTIRNELDPGATPSRQGDEGRSLKGRLGSGGPRLRIRTGDGGIRLRRL